MAEKKTDKKPFFPKDVRPGTLIVVEWQDGSGKSTQVKILQKLLESNGFYVHFTEWNSNPRIKPLTKKLKTEDLSLPAPVFDMVHAADLMERYITEIAGMLRAGMVVLCDRYIYTALARGYARGLEIKDLRYFYDEYFPIPDMTFYFRLPVEAGMKRAASRSGLKHYEAGMDMQFSDNILHNFHAFQTRVVDAYDRLSETENMYVLDAVKAGLWNNSRDAKACRWIFPKEVWYGAYLRTVINYKTTNYNFQSIYET
jgi:dTMP kinase